jgi:hypothetical protein
MIFCKFSKISNRVRIATCGSQHEVLLFACLDRKAEKTSISQCAFIPCSSPPRSNHAFRKIRICFRRLVVAGKRLRVAVQVLKRVAPNVEDCGVVRVDRQRLIEACKRLCSAIQVAKCVAAIVESFGAVWFDGQCLVVASENLAD